MRSLPAVSRAFWVLSRALNLVLFIGLSALTSAYAQGAGYWHTSGAQIYDANNQPVRIAGVNWYGFETTDLVAHGLTAQDYKVILQGIKNNGYNTVRLPFSNQMVETPGTNLNISFYSNFGAMNTDLQGLNSLQVMDRIVGYAGTIGLKVILDNHRSEAGNSAEANGLWYTGNYPESAWTADWQALATRYASNATVIGMDLRNEPHNANSGGACWDCGGVNDWHLAAGRAGNAVLAVNPSLLIFVEGVDAYNNDYYWWGGNLEGVATSPVKLNVANRLVYSPHDYGPQEYGQSWFPGDSAASLQGVWNKHWGYIAAAGTAPVWIGEFGTRNSNSDVSDTASGSQGLWFSSLVSYLKASPSMSWTYWALNGEDAYGLLDSNYDPTPLNALKQATLATIQFPLSIGTTTASAPVAPTGLAATASSSSRISLSWLPSATGGVTSYTVYFGTSAGSIGTVLASGLTTTSDTAIGLNASVTYYFTVVAVSPSGTSPVSGAASATTQAAAVPNAPTGLTATSVSASQINLAWTASAGSGMTYSVYSALSQGGNAVQLAGGVAGTSYSATGLLAGTQYSFSVVATSSAGSSAPTNIVSTSTQSAVAPAAPSSLVASASSATQINLAWTASSTAGATYNVYGGATASSTTNLVASGVTTSGYAVGGLTASTMYFFTVKALVNTAASAASNVASATTQATSATPPVAPFGLSASPSSASQVNLNWQPSTTSGVTYAVYLGTANGITTTLVGSGIQGQNFTVNGLKDFTTYYFTVKAMTSGGVGSVASNQATAQTQTLPSTPPTGLSAAAVSATQINLSWTGVVNTGATYSVYYGTIAGAENTQLANGINATNYAVTALTSSTTYYFIVRSVSQGGTSAPSVEAGATTTAVSVPVTPVIPPSTPAVPSAPGGLAAAATSPSQITLGWAASATTGVTYTVYQGTSAALINTMVAGGVTGTGYTLSGLTASTTYFYTVTASNSAGASGLSNTATATTLAPPAPIAPSGLTAVATSSSQVTLSWTASPTTGVTYTVYSGTAAGAETNQLASGVSGTSYSVTGLTASTTYFYLLKAVVGTAASRPSNEASATTQAAAGGGCHVAYTDQTDWGAGFTGGLAITNNGTATMNNWTVSWTFSGNQQMSQSWNGNYTQNGQTVSIASMSYNGTIAAGGTLSGIGWNASYSGTNTNPVQFYVNGVACH